MRNHHLDIWLRFHNYYVSVGSLELVGPLVKKDLYKSLIRNTNHVIVWRKYSSTQVFFWFWRQWVVVRGEVWWIWRIYHINYVKFHWNDWSKSVDFDPSQWTILEVRHILYWTFCIKQTMKTRYLFDKISFACILLLLQVKWNFKGELQMSYKKYLTDTYIVDLNLLRHYQWFQQKHFLPTSGSKTYFTPNSVGFP